MAEINPNIALGVRPVEIPNQLAQFGQYLGARNAMNQGRLADVQYQNALRSQQDEAATRQAIMGAGGDYGQAVNALLAKGLYQPAGAIAKSQQDLAVGKANLTKTNLANATSAAAIHRDQLVSVNDPESAAAWVQAGYKDPNLAPILSGVPVEQALAKIPSDPAQFQAWKQQNALGATKFIELNKPQNLTQNLGGTSQVLSIPGLGGTPVVASSSPTTATPDALMIDLRARTEGAANRGVTMRGQNLTDARQRELNGIMADGSVSPDLEATARGIASGQIAPLSGYALGRPGGRAVMARVMALNPDYNAQDYQAGQKGLSAFTSGTQGNLVRSFNVATSHLDTLGQLADALNNKDVQLVNKLGNSISAQVGKPAPTNFDAAKSIVADEITKAILGSKGALGDRQAAMDTISRANSPAQLRGVIDTYKTLMAGQLGGLKQQYEQATGRKDFDRFLATHGSSPSANPHAAKTDAEIKKELGL